MKIMVCYDDSDLSQLIINTAKAYSEKLDASIEVVHVMTIDATVKPSEIPAAEVEFTKKMGEVMKGVTNQYIAQLLVSNEQVGETLVDYAVANQFDLMFVGIERKSRVGKLLMGSTAQTIILTAPCPVVAVK